MSQTMDEERPMEAEVSLLWSTDADAPTEVEPEELHNKMTAIRSKRVDERMDRFVVVEGL